MSDNSLVEMFFEEGVRVSLYLGSTDGYWCLVHFPQRTPGTHGYSTTEQAKNAAKDMIRGYRSALQDSSDFISRHVQGLLSDMRGIYHVD